MLGWLQYANGPCIRPSQPESPAPPVSDLGEVAGIGNLRDMIRSSERMRGKVVEPWKWGRAVGDRTSAKAVSVHGPPLTQPVWHRVRAHPSLE